MKDRGFSPADLGVFVYVCARRRGGGGVLAAGRRYSSEKHIKLWVYMLSDCKKSPPPRYLGEF